MATTVLESLDSRVPSWAKGELVEVHCPVCAFEAANPIVTRADGLMVRSCARCGLLYVSPRPSDSALNEFYSRYSEVHQKIDCEDESYWRGISRSRYGFLRGNCRTHVLKRVGIDIKGKRILDVGCGNSRFLLLCQNHGAGHVAGIEPDKKMAIAARKRLGLDVYAGYLGDLPADENRFDLVVLWDVLEHIAYPRDLLTGLRGVLAPGGYLAATSPNADCLKQEGNQWTGFKVDFEHMCYYGRDSARCLFESCGFSLEAAVPFAQPCLDSITYSGKKPGFLKSLVNVAVNKVQVFDPFDPIVGRLVSIPAALRNIGRESQGRYVLYMLARKEERV